MESIQSDFPPHLFWRMDFWLSFESILKQIEVLKEIKNGIWSLLEYRYLIIWAKLRTGALTQEAPKESQAVVLRADWP